MNIRWLRVIAAGMLLLLFSFSGFAQQGTGERLTAASFDGTSGLFKTWDAENLQRGEANFGFGYDQFYRDPGQLTIGRAVAGAAVGVHTRFELFASMDVQKHIEAKDIRQGWGTVPLPAQVSPATQAASGLTYYYSPTAPFIDTARSNGRGDVRVGLKINLLSERRGQPVSLGIVGFGILPGQTSRTGMRRGLSTGAYQAGFAVLVSKTAADIVRFHLNGGVTLADDPDLSWITPQAEINYRYGAEFPANSRFRVIAEMSGTKYIGDPDNGIDPWGPNPPNSLEAIVGMRVYPKKWLSVAGGYQASLHHLTKDPGVERGDYHGFVVQGTLGIRKSGGAKNQPPTVNCAASTGSVVQNESVTIRANASDPDDDALTYSWTSTGGQVSGSGDTVSFRAAEPGKYTITVKVSDGRQSVECSREITVTKKAGVAPTVSVEPATFSLLPGESANLRCAASDANNAPLTYSWTVNGQKLAAEGPQVTFGSEGRNPGAYEVACTVSNGELSATASSKGTIRQRENRNPTIQCQTTTVDVASGKSVELSASASDPDGDNLTYNWSAPGGAVNGNGSKATFNASGVKAGRYSVTVGVDDGRGGKASCNMTVNVSERLVVADAKRNCGYFKAGASRVDNCAKAILDDLAVRMKNESNLSAELIGYTDSTKLEQGQKALGEARAKAVAAYLKERGVDSSRLKITNGGSSNPAADNATSRRVEIELTVK